MLLLHARYLVPICEPPIENGTVGIADGRLRYIGPRESAPGADEERDLGDVILMPGLVNAHTHLELTVMRGFLEDLEFRRWILRLTSARRSVLTSEMLLDSARLGIEEGLAAGITTYADTGSSGAPFTAMLEAKVRGIAYQEVFGPDPAACDSMLSGLHDTVNAAVPRQTPLVRIGVSPHAPYTVSDALFRATADFAASMGHPMAIHIAESDAESRLVTDGVGPFADGLRARGIDVGPRSRSPVQLLFDTGALRPRPLLIHCVRVDAADQRLIAEAGCPVAHCPVSNAKLGHGIAPLLELLDAGITVGLGSDSVASNNRMDLLEEARVALLMQRARIGSSEVLTAHDVLELATFGSASALGLESEIGSLEVGKSADLAAFPIGARAPVQDPESSAVFAMGGSSASFVMVAGRVLRDGDATTGDRGVVTRVQETAGLLREWLATGGEMVPPPPVVAVATS